MFSKFIFIFLYIFHNRVSPIGAAYSSKSEIKLKIHRSTNVVLRKPQQSASSGVQLSNQKFLENITSEILPYTCIVCTHAGRSMQYIILKNRSIYILTKKIFD